MTDKHRRILIRHNQTIYRLINYVLNDSDGSFYFWTMREGVNLDSDPPRPKKIKVSYHSSGRINFHHSAEIYIIYSEPIANITSPFRLAVFSIPSIEKLDVYRKNIQETDYVIDMTKAPSGRIEFVFVIAPWNSVFTATGGTVSIRYENIFSFTVLMRPPLLQVSDVLNEHFVFFAHLDGLYDIQQLDKDLARIAFKKKLRNTDQTIFFPQSADGIHKIIFRTPMRIPPNVEIVFQDETLQAEVIEKTTAFIKFKIKDRHGAYVKDDRPISKIVLSAEL